MSKREITVVFVVVMLAAAIGCSSGGSSGGGAIAPGSSGSSDTAVFVKDMPPVALADGRMMAELFLRVTQVDLIDDTGQPVNVPLASGAPFVDFDLMTLEDTATLLAVGTVPNGSYRTLIFTLDQASCHFVDVAGALQPLDVPNPAFEVAFLPPVDTAVNNAIVLDIRPDQVVEVVTPGTDYRLTNGTDAAVAGTPGSAPGIPPSMPVVDVAGFITALADPVFTLNNAIDVDTQGASLLEKGTGASLAFSDLAVGHRVKVNGTLTQATPGAAIIASSVEINRNHPRASRGAGGGAAGGNPGRGNGGAGASPGVTGRPANAGMPRLRGTIANLDAAGSPPSFDIVRGPGIAIAHVEIITSATIFDRPTQSTIAVGDLADGDSVEVMGHLANQGGANAGAAGGPPAGRPVAGAGGPPAGVGGGQPAGVGGGRPASPPGRGSAGAPPAGGGAATPPAPAGGGGAPGPAQPPIQMQAAQVERRS